MKPHRSLRALLVDIQPAHARVIERALAEAGWQMDGEHSTGAEGLSAALSHRGWNAVLYGGDGPDAVPARKALALVRLADPYLPFLAVSPYVQAGALAAIVRGLDGVAVVPDPARLPAALTRALDATKLRRRVGGAHRLLLAQQAITDAIAAGLETEELAAHVLATLGETLGWSCGVVWRPAADGLLHSAGTWHAGTRPEVIALAAAADETRFAPGQGLPGRVYAFRRPAWVADVGRGGDEPRAPLARRAGLMTAVAFPLAHGDRCAGVIEFFSRGINEPNAEVSALFGTVGGQLAQYLERRRHERGTAAAGEAIAGDDRLRRLLDATGALVAVLDAEGRVRLAGERMCAALGVSEADLVGAHWAAAAVPPAEREAFAGALAAAGDAPASVLHALAGGDTPVLWQLAAVADPDGPLVLVTGKPPAAGSTDTVTGLADRAALRAAVAGAVEAAGTDRSGVTVMALDIDDVRLVGDSLGPAVGGALLRELAARLADALPDAGLIARAGVDELFVLLAGADADPESAERVADRALTALARPVRLGRDDIRVSASAGIATYPRDAATADELLARAARAAHRAKQMRRGSWAAYAPGHTSRLDTLSTAAGLHLAMDRGQLELHWQPIYALRSSRIAALEALLRWNHPERGLVGPSEFIPVAEETGVIEALGEWVIDAVCAQQAAWALEGLRPQLSFNVSPTQLRRVDFVERVAARLRDWDADTSRLTVELTESSTLEDPATAEPIVRDLHALGLRIALDDFGSGYSSLSRLRELPVSMLKIDRAFLRDVPERPEAGAVVTAILSLAKALGRIAVAEGVETDAQRAFLLEQGCPLAQGFLLGRPLPAAEAALLMAAPSLRPDRPVSAAPRG